MTVQPAVPVAVLSASHRSGHRREPDRLLGPPHELRRGRHADRPACRVLRGPRRGRRRARDHRGALGPPDGLALREAHPRLRPGGRSPATAGSPTRSTATARRSSPRSTTTAARAPGCTRAFRSGRRRRWPTRCSARCPRPSRSPRSPRSSPATPRWRLTAREGGFDGIELQCSHSSIVRGFLSPATNLRTDGYGGSLERRARLLLEILRAVRDDVGRRSSPSASGCAATSSSTGARRSPRRWPWRGWSRSRAVPTT